MRSSWSSWISIIPPCRHAADLARKGRTKAAARAAASAMFAHPFRHPVNEAEIPSLAGAINQRLPEQVEWLTRLADNYLLVEPARRPDLRGQPRRGAGPVPLVLPVVEAPRRFRACPGQAVPPDGRAEVPRRGGGAHAADRGGDGRPARRRACRGVRTGTRTATSVRTNRGTSPKRSATACRTCGRTCRLTRRCCLPRPCWRWRSSISARAATT